MDGSAWVSLVPFQMTVTLPGIPPVFTYALSRLPPSAGEAVEWVTAQ